MKNTCSIKLLGSVHIGAGIRMSKDKNTVAFDNKPMSDMLIEKYMKQGFHLSHESLPKNIWVDFDQLPLTRLKIENGVIKDELTFVENIVIHRMQLIKTMDTEYIELLYNEAQLAKKEEAEEIISLSVGIPGHIYKGAQCEDGNEMIFLGTYYTKNICQLTNQWGGRYSSQQFKPDYRISDVSPRRAFFLIPDNSDLSQKVECEIKARCGLDVDRDYYSRNSDNYHLDMDQREARAIRIDSYLKVKKKLLQELLLKDDSFKIVDYPVTSKRIKKLIKTDKLDDRFTNNEYCKDVIFQSNNFTRPRSSRDKRDWTAELKSENQINIAIEITNHYYRRCDANYIQIDKKDIDQNAIEFINENFDITLNQSNPINND